MSPLQVSRALGVSETTVKRWVDEGKLPAQRTEGGHRRILVQDVVSYANQRNWPQINLAQLLSEQTTTFINLTTLSEQFFTALRQDDAEQARSLLLGAQQSGLSLAQIADEVISPVMARVGHGWASGQLDVYDEHRATQVCLAALLAIKARMDSAGDPGPEQPLALGAGPEFDHYILANLLIELALREMGWRVVNVGPNTPFASLTRAMKDLKPKLLWLSCSYLADVECFVAGYRTLYEEAVRQGVAVAVGGRALSEGIRERMTFTHHGDRLAHLVAFARQTYAAKPR